MMTFQKFSTIASVVISVAFVSPQQLSAGTFGNLTYTDKGSSITIDSCDRYRSGNVIIPSVIDGKPVTVIGDYAFLYCTFSILAIPSGVTSIGSNAFEYCTNLNNITLPNTLTSIGENAFNFCLGLENVVIPKGVTSFDRGFANCPNLRSVVIQQGVTQIGISAFDRCGKLKSVVIPSSVKTVGDHAFSDSGLTSIKLPPTVTAIGKGAFERCRALKSVKLPPNITEIGDRMFADCNLFTPPAIPSKVNRIGDEAFSYCKLPYTVVIPASVKQIGNKAFTSSGNQNYGFFASSGNLKSAVFTGKAPEMGTHVFDGATSDFKIFFPEGKSGYTLPKWFGYRASISAAEIEVLAESKKSIINGSVITKFGAVIVGKSSIVKRFTILNVGSRNLTGLSAKTDGDNASDYIVKPLTKSSLAPGKSTKVEIQFLPKKSGNRHAQLRIMSSDGNENPFIINLKGTGLKLID